MAHTSKYFYTLGLHTFGWLALLLPAFCSAAVAALDGDPKITGTAVSVLAAEVLRAAGARRGIAIEWGSADASLALELAKQAELRVYRVQDAPLAVGRERAAVEAAGLSALRVRIEAGPLETLEYPNYAANLVLCAGLPEAPRLKEWGRIMRPEGFLFLFPARDATGKFGVEEVKSHLAQHGAGGWQEPRACGAAVCVRRAKLEGAAEWSHYFRDPDNNRYSPDKLIRAPLRPLWFGAPSHPLGDLFFTQGLSAGGRLLLTDASPSDTTRARLTCLDAYNGMLLWEREAGGGRYTKVEGPKADPNLRLFQLPGWVQNGELAVSGERVYLTDSKECLVLDAAGGQDLARFKAPPPTHPENCWRFVAFQGEVLFGYANAPAAMPGAKPAAPPPAGGPPALFALERASGAPRWVRGGADGDELGVQFGPPLALGEERLFIRVNKTALHALDARSGKTVWKAEGLEEAAAEKETWWEGVVHGGKFLLYKFNVRVWGSKKKLATLIFATADGKRLGEQTTDLEKEVFFNAQEGFLGAPSTPRLGCNYGTAAGPFYFHRNGYFLEKPGTPITSPSNAVSYGGFRAACGTGALPANGLVHLLPNGLGCGCAPFQATVAYESGLGIEKPPATFKPAPEEHGSIQEAQQLAATEKDWPTYLSNSARSGCTPQDLAGPRTLAWETRVTGVPTPCIAVGEQVFLGSTDECVYALNAATGAVRWKFHTGGPVRAAPAYGNGRIYAGSDDGWLYALSAADGKLLWRLRGGSSARKQIAFESVISPWPLTQGVALDPERVYFTAGLLSGQEIHAYAADARTGQVQWRTPLGSTCIVPCGYLALNPERVIFPSPGSAAIYHPVHLSRKDGTRQSAGVTHSDYSEVRCVEGCEADEPEFRKGFYVHGGGAGVQRGYRAGAGYSGGARKSDGPYHLQSDVLSTATQKIPDRAWFADGHSFLPLFTANGVYFRMRQVLLAVERANLGKYLAIREQKGNEREPFIKWKAKDLPCGEAAWLLAATGAKAGDPVTLLAGGPKGVAAISEADGKVLWSVGWDGATLPAAVARGRIYLASPDGRVRALAAP